MQHAHEMLIGLGAKLHPPANSSQIDLIAQELGIVLPNDVRVLYELSNGSAGEFGELSWVFSPIDTREIILGRYLKQPRNFVISPAQRKIDPNKYVRFFDCLIDAPLYAYCADPHSANYGEVIGCTTDGGTFDAFVSAKSVSRFLEMLSETRGADMILIDEEKTK